MGCVRNHIQGFECYQTQIFCRRDLEILVIFCLICHDPFFFKDICQYPNTFPINIFLWENFLFYTTNLFFFLICLFRGISFSPFLFLIFFFPFHTIFHHYFFLHSYDANAMHYTHILETIISRIHFYFSNIVQQSQHSTPIIFFIQFS